MTKLLEKLIPAACVVSIVAGLAMVVSGVERHLRAGPPQVRLEMSELPPQTLRRIVREEMEAEFTRLEVMREALRSDLEEARKGGK